MNPTQEQHRQFEFAFPALDALVLVEEDEAGVLIRTTRDNFSDERKEAFVRELVQEGFVADRYRWSPTGEWAKTGVRWRTDCSWVHRSEVAIARARHFMTKLFVSSACLWVAIMSILFMVQAR